jgi:hypothetical protein
VIRANRLAFPKAVRVLATHEPDAFSLRAKGLREIGRPCDGVCHAAGLLYANFVRQLAQRGDERARRALQLERQPAADGFEPAVFGALFC